MRAPRKPNLPAALVDLGFAAAAGALGALSVGWIAFIGLVILHLGAWALVRRAGLRAMSREALPRTLAISVGLIAIVDSCAFLVGAWFSGDPS